MTSPHAARPLSPPCASPGVADGPSSSSTIGRYSTRPFSTPEGGGELLDVLVHFGRNLETLTPHEDTLEDRDTRERERRLQTFVVASVGHFAGSPTAIQCQRSSNSRKTPDDAPTTRQLYQQSFSPYAATRVVVGGTAPTWNELLALPLPIDWRKTTVETTPALALKLELVERGDSQQEDFLLGSCVLPLASLTCQQHQTRFALAFASSSVSAGSYACIYVSLQMSRRGLEPNDMLPERLEATIESFTPVVATGSDAEGLPTNCSSLAMQLQLQLEPTARFKATSDVVAAPSALEDTFQLLHDGQSLAPTGDVAMELSGVTPATCTPTGSVSDIFEWRFPLSFALPPDAVVSAVDVMLFATSDTPHRLVGRGHLELTKELALGPKDGSPRRHTVIPMVLEDDSKRTLGHAALKLRWWDADAWSVFLRDSTTRRVVCSNRWTRASRPALTWLGAVFRGLNRHPVASLCDVSGVSGVLTELLVESSPPATDSHLEPLPQRETHAPDGGGDVRVLLREQVAHLQAEGVAQREQIQRLQSELDTRLAAIKTCGLELVALRRDARQKETQMQALQERVEAATRREQQQLAEMLGPEDSRSDGSTKAARPGQQAGSQRFALLASKYKELDREHQVTTQQLAETRRTLAGYNDLETRHAELQEAHLVQASLVQRLQRDKQQTAALKKTVRMQEKVIRQFEQAVAQRSTENVTSNSDGDGVETREALLRVRVQVLEQQLQANARDAAAEISELRMRVLELEKSDDNRSDGSAEQ